MPTINPVARLSPEEKEVLDQERFDLLQEVEEFLERPLVFLGFAWLAILIVQLVHGASRLLLDIGYTIWGIFVVDFLIRFLLAPRKVEFLKRNWLTAISLILPALRVLRVVSAFRSLALLPVTGGARVVSIVGSLNRGMRALRATMGRRGFGYVAALTVIVIFVGAAGIFSFESAMPGARTVHTYAGSVWWTAMLVTTLGSDYWPQTAPGRLLCLGLAIYAFTVFGYLTATLATFFIDRDAESPDTDVASAASIAALHDEISALRAEIRALHPQPSPPERAG